MSDYWSIYQRGSMLRKTDPDQALQGMIAGRDLAEAANDKQALIYMNHWILQLMIFEKRDYQGAYDLAVKTALEARKPEYQHRQERICTQQDLILTYEGIDLEGYEELIEDALKYMISQVTPEIQCRRCLQGLLCSTAIGLERTEKAIQYSREYLDVAENAGWHSHHHTINAYEHLCEAVSLQKDWHAMIKYALVALQLIGKDIYYNTSAASLHAAMAYAYQMLDQPKDAQLAYQKAVNMANHTKAELPTSYYNFMTAYHLGVGELEKALHIRERHIASMEGRGQIFWECLARIDRCRLLKKLGRDYAEELATVKTLIPKLKKPTVMEERLAAALAG